MNNHSNPVKSEEEQSDVKTRFQETMHRVFNGMNVLKSIEFSGLRFSWTLKRHRNGADGLNL